MNRFKQAVYDCMIPTAQLLERTKKPLHRAILLNFWRHVHLEGAGQYDKILVRWGADTMPPFECCVDGIMPPVPRLE